MKRKGERTNDGSEQEMIGEEFHLVHLEMIPQLMHLEPRLVVNVDVLLLRDGEEGFVVQPPNRSTRLAKMELGVEAT